MTVLTDLPRDFRYAARSLLRTPGFTLVAVTVLALGIGATSAIFSLVSAVWLQPLPFADVERVVSVWIDNSAGGGPARGQLTPAHYADWRDRAQSFEEMAPVEPATVNLTGDGGEPERLSAVRSTPNLFATIGLAPIAGRTFLPDDGASEAVVVSEGFWLRRFGGDRAAVGRTITLDGVPHEIVGIVPRDFRFPIFPVAEKDVFIATVFPPDVLANRGTFSWFSVAKLRAGVSLEAAEAELRAIAAALNAETPNSMPRTPALVPLRETLARSVGPSTDRDVGPTLFALLGAVGFVLLIACANVANLMLARATVRQRELAIRKALGAAQGRVLRQLLTESALLAGVSVLLGLGLAAASFGYLRRLLPDTLPASAGLALDWRVLALTAGTALVTVLLFGAGPALAAARRDFGAAFGRAVGTHGRRARQLRTTLVVAEIALTVVLLAGAGLLLRSYAAVLAVDPGFNADGLLVADTPLSPTRYANAADRDAFYQRVLERVRELPGVQSAGYTNFAPLVIDGGRSIVFHEGRPLTMAEIQRMAPGELQRLLASNRGVSPGYLETLGVPLVSGRFIDARDSRGAPGAAVINETMARAFWPDADPLGRRFRMGVGGDTLFTVVGVVGDIKAVGLDVPAFAEAYLPLDQLVFPFMWPQQLVVRSSGDPLALGNPVRQAIRDIDADQPVARVVTMNEVIDGKLVGRNTQLTLIGSFAVIALLLAAVGLFGVLSYTVSQRTNEIGLRMALGAAEGSVVGSVVGSALAMAVLGIGIGLVAAYALTRTIASFLYEVSPTDPVTAAAVAGVLLLVAALAAFVPARRAATINPMVALRADG
jgi:putative ABC transport system permease protein